MDKVVAKILRSSCDVEHMWNGRNANWGVCPTCHNTLLQIVNPSYRIGKKLRDYYITYDGFYIVSERFKAFCEERQYPHLSFVALPKSPGYYFFTPEDIYYLDYGMSEFSNKRECCGSYDEIIKIPQKKSQDFTIDSDDFFRRSNYMLGSYSSKSPLIIIGLKTAEEVENAKLTGLYIKDIYE